MTKSQIEDLCDRYLKRADKNFSAYQETGMARYLNEYHKASEVIDVCNQALSAADDHDALLNLRGQIADLANKALTEDPEKVVKELKQLAVNFGFARDIGGKKHGEGL